MIKPKQFRPQTVIDCAQHLYKAARLPTAIVRGTAQSVEVTEERPAEPNHLPISGSGASFSRDEVALAR
jgi:hypothetical protein